MKPYTQVTKNGYILRKFDANVPNKELVWHRDRNDRLVEILSGEDWNFQLDNQLPIPLTAGMKIFIPKETYHRIQKGKTTLEISVQEF